MKFILFLCACAFVALLINRWKKVPKSIFLFFVISIVVSLCWFTLNFSEENPVGKTQQKEEKKDGIFFEVAKDIRISPGETRVALPAIGDNYQFGNHLRLQFVCNGAFTEQLFVDKVSFSLLLSDGTILPESGVSIENDGDKGFPEAFILKVFFNEKEMSSVAKVKCLIVDNKFEETLVVPEVSIGYKSH